MSLFKKAERKQAKLKVMISGVSGSGKTYSALLIASGMGKKIALIDTENASAALYADKFEFDTLVLEPPFTIQKYTEAMNAAEAAGYDVLVVDSLSHAWAGEGGILDKKAKMDARGGNSFTNWSSLTPEQEVFKSEIVGAKIHMVCTVRSKTEYAIETNEKGKQAPRKVGLAPIQRDGLEYEFTTVLDMAMDHSATASKDRTGLFDGQFFKPTKETGEALMTWLSSAKPGDVSRDAPRPEPQSQPTSIVKPNNPLRHDPGSIDAPACCGKLMMVSRYPDKEFAINPWFCSGCKRKAARDDVA